MQFVGKVDDDDDDGKVAEDCSYAEGSFRMPPRSDSNSPMPLSARSITSMADSQIDDISTSFLPAQIEDEFYTQNRELICDDALLWLDSFADDSLPGCVFTSLPDISEVPEVSKGFKEVDRYRVYKGWFTDTAALVMRKMKPMTYAIFLQSDIRVILGNSRITEWVDKSHLLNTAADREGCTLMWHKIVLLQSGALSRQGLGRPLFSHLLCFGKGPVTYRSGAFASPDVFDRGHMLWPRAIGLDSCFLGLTFLKEVAMAECVIDPFCGVGTVCAMANALGMATIGVELSAKRCKKARSLSLRDFVNKMEHKRKCFLGHVPDRPKAIKGFKNKAERKSDKESKHANSPLQGGGRKHRSHHTGSTGPLLVETASSSYHRQLRASAEAKTSLEFVSEIESNSVESDDCSTISVGSPRYGSPNERRDRRTSSLSSNSREIDRYNRDRDKGVRRPSRSGEEEGKVSSSNFYSVDSKIMHTQSADDAKAVLADITDAKTESYDTDAKGVLIGTDMKDVLTLEGDAKLLTMDSKSVIHTDSIMERRGSGNMDAIRISAALMTAGGAGLDSRVAIDSSPTRETSSDKNREREAAREAGRELGREGNKDDRENREDREDRESRDDRDAIASSSGPRLVPSHSSHDVSSLTEDLSTAMGLSKSSSAVYLYVAPTPSPMASSASVSAFSGRLLAHQISADPVREAERKRGLSQNRQTNRSQNLPEIVEGAAADTSPRTVTDASGVSGGSPRGATGGVGGVGGDVRGGEGTDRSERSEGGEGGEGS